MKVFAIQVLQRIWRFVRKKSPARNLFILCVFGLLWLIVSNFGGSAESHQNYFDIRGSGPILYLIDNPKCKIMNVSEWDKSILPFYKPEEWDDKIWPPECAKRPARHWTYITNGMVVINETALSESGFSMGSITCCYLWITRIEQNYTHFDSSADERIKWSKECCPMRKLTTVVDHEFIRVICTSKYLPLPSAAVLYKQSHPVPRFEVVSAEKRNYWSSKSTHPPNVIIFGLDAVSRLNFRRSMPESRRVLEESGAIEVLGYTKVGENTFPNLAALLSGHSKRKFLDICRTNVTDTRHDFCPYIWRNFSSVGYATALIEDRIDISMSTFKAMGFIKKPVDFFFRPFMLSVYYHQPYHQFGKWLKKPNAMDCVDSKTVDEVIIDYNQGLTNLSVPVFVFSWNTNLAHDDITAPRNVDHIYANYFRKETAKSNTILIFLSDHGSRNGGIRKTFVGWYEDKLPNLWVFLSPDIRRKFPQWYNQLQVNSRKLTTPFDLYHTLVKILKIFSPDRMSNSKHLQPGLSIFDEIPDRTCAEAGIDDAHCPCAAPKAIGLDDPLLKSAADSVVLFFRASLPPQCAKLDLDTITAGAILNSYDTISTYIVALILQPGNIQVEGQVDYDSSTGLFDAKPDFTRLNRMTRHVGCITDQHLEKFCYCP